MKRNRVLILLVAVVLIISACSNTPTADPPAETPAEPVALEPETPSEAPASNEPTAPETDEPKTTEPETVEAEKPKTGSERDIMGMPIPQNENILVKIDDIRYEITIDEEPDSTGTLWAMRTIPIIRFAFSN